MYPGAGQPRGQPQPVYGYGAPPQMAQQQYAARPAGGMPTAVPTSGGSMGGNPYRQNPGGMYAPVSQAYPPQQQQQAYQQAPPQYYQPAPMAQYQQQPPQGYAMPQQAYGVPQQQGYAMPQQAPPPYYQPPAAQVPSQQQQQQQRREPVPVMIDTNGDGVPDAVGYDTNGDGHIDAIDFNGDGVIDQRIPAPSAPQPHHHQQQSQSHFGYAPQQQQQQPYHQAQFPSGTAPYVPPVATPYVPSSTTPSAPPAYHSAPVVVGGFGAPVSAFNSAKPTHQIAGFSPNPTQPQTGYPSSSSAPTHASGVPVAHAVAVAMPVAASGQQQQAGSSSSSMASLNQPPPPTYASGGHAKQGGASPAVAVALPSQSSGVSPTTNSGGLLDFRSQGAQKAAEAPKGTVAVQGTDGLLYASHGARSTGPTGNNDGAAVGAVVGVAAVGGVAAAAIANPQAAEVAGKAIAGGVGAAVGFVSGMFN